jgi:hypothetical protein
MAGVVVISLPLLWGSAYQKPPLLWGPAYQNPR